MIKRKYLFKIMLVLVIFILVPAMKRRMEQLPEEAPMATRVKVTQVKNFMPEERSQQSIILDQSTWSKSELLKNIVDLAPDPAANQPLIVGAQLFNRLQTIVPFLFMPQQEIEQIMANLNGDALWQLFVEFDFFGISTLRDMVLKELVSEKNLPLLVQKFIEDTLKNYRLNPALKKMLAKAIDLRCVTNIFPAKKIKTTVLDLPHLYSHVVWADTNTPIFIIRSSSDAIVLKNEQTTQLSEDNILSRDKKKSIVMPQEHADPFMVSIYNWDMPEPVTPHSFFIAWPGVESPNFFTNNDATKIALVDHNGDNSVRIFDMDGTEILLNTEDAITATVVQFSSDGKEVAFLSSDGLEIWDLEEGLLKKRLDSDETIVDIAWTNDGKRFIANTKNSVIIWNAQTYEKLHELSKETSVGGELYVNSDGKFVAIRHPYDKDVSVWNVENGEQQLHVQVKPYTHSAYSLLAWHPNGKYLAVAVEDRVQVWDIPSKMLIREIEVQVDNPSWDSWEPTVSGFDWSPDGRYLAILDKRGNLTTGELPQEVSTDSLEQALLLRYLCSQIEAGKQIPLQEFDPEVLQLLKAFDPSLTSDEHILSVYQKLPENIKSVLEPLMTFVK